MGFADELVPGRALEARPELLQARRHGAARQDRELGRPRGGRAAAPPRGRALRRRAKRCAWCFSPMVRRRHRATRFIKRSARRGDAVKRPGCASLVCPPPAPQRRRDHQRIPGCCRKVTQPASCPCYDLPAMESVTGSGVMIKKLLAGRGLRLARSLERRRPVAADLPVRPRSWRRSSPISGPDSTPAPTSATAGGTGTAAVLSPIFPTGSGVTSTTIGGPGGLRY